MLWTRIAPEPLEGGGAGRDPISVRWEVAHDERFSRTVRSGSTDAVAENAHAVHVVADGLEPGRWYFYRFIVHGESSAVGRTRTAPERTAAVPSLRIAFGSCQHFEFGFYGAHRHIVDDSPDLMIFLGDYIYEGPGRAGPGPAPPRSGGPQPGAVPQPLCALQDGPGPPAAARRAPVAGDVRRPRGRQ